MKFFFVFITILLSIFSVESLAVKVPSLYWTVPLTTSVFTSSVEGPVMDKDLNLYAVGFDRSRGVGIVDKDGNAKLYVYVPEKGTPNALQIVNNFMYFADYFNHRIWKMDMKTMAFTVIAENKNMNQPNDIAITSKGYIYATDPNWKNKDGNLWKITPDGKTICLESNMGTTNGIEISPDEKNLYVAETVQGNVWAYDIDDNGDVSNKRLLIKFGSDGSDGMKCDSKGNLYVARNGRGTIAMITSSGKLLREIKVSSKNPSNICFGGKDGKTAYVTSITSDEKNGQIEVFRTEFPGRAWKTNK